MAEYARLLCGRQRPHGSWAWYAQSCRDAQELEDARTWATQGGRWTIIRVMPPLQEIPMDVQLSMEYRNDSHL